MKLNIWKILAFCIFLSTLQSCPGYTGSEYDCGHGGGFVPELASISPFKTTYVQGEIIIYKLMVQSTNTYFGGDPVNIKAISGADSGEFRPQLKDLLFQNEEIISKGQKPGTDLYLIKYNPVTDAYELEISIKLDRKGFYDFPSSGNVVFKRGPNCEIFNFVTYVKGETSDAKIQFEVL